MMLTSEPKPESRPCLLLAHQDPAYRAVASRYFRQCGWDVYLAASGPEIRSLAHLFEPTVVVLDTALPEESGWLTCEKLHWSHMDLKVILVASNPRPEAHRFANFVGAADLIDRHDGVVRLVDAVCNAAQRAVC